MTTAIVTTTIYVPEALRKYAENAVEHGHSDVFFVVTGDLKTPESASQLCQEVQDRYGLPVHYLSADDQRTYMRKYPELDEFLPWCCIQRRNVSVLYAYEKGASNIITIDDDNLFRGGDYVGDHLAMLSGSREVDILSSTTGWLNVCQFLEDENSVKFYHRGYPEDERWRKEETCELKSKRAVDTVVNAGFWFLDPDVDAIQRLVYPVNVISCSRTENFALEKGTWSPFNSQNTALKRECIPAYFLFPKIGRYDDIWASYVIRRVSDELNQHVTYGGPVVNQERNPHDFFRDEDDERLGYTLTPSFCRWLRGTSDGGFRLTQKSYDGVLPELGAQLRDVLDRSDVEAGKLLGRVINGNQRPLTEKERAYYDTLAEGCHVWVKTMNRV